VVKGLALARDLPVVGVSSLAMLALRAMRASGAAQAASVIDARMNEVYFGAYAQAPDGGLVCVVPDQVGAAAALPALPAGDWRGVGTGWAVYETPLRAALKARIAAVEPAALPHAEDALRLALPEFAAGRAASADVLAPAYLRDRVALTLIEQAAQRR
jgi:tRNA threonylcarbamoyladenosine biosynthesis protein TsaB